MQHGQRVADKHDMNHDFAWNDEKMRWFDSLAKWIAA